MTDDAPPKLPMLKVALATLLGPVAVAPLVGVGAGFFAEPQDAIWWFLRGTAVAAVLGGVGAALVGVPIALWRLRSAGTPPTHWAVAGASAGLVAATPPLLLAFFEPYSRPGSLGVALAAFAFVTASALAAWLIVHRLPWRGGR